MANEKLNATIIADNQIYVASLSDEDDVNDPLEAINRSIFKFNEFILNLLLRPISNVYNDNLPAVFRIGVKNFLTNLSSPISVANHLLQGEPDEALRSVGRIMANTIVGFGGLVDVASELGAPGRKEDFGQTLSVWGINEGIYLVLPIFGPSNPRDLVGKFIVDPYFNATGNWISNTNKNAIDWSLKATSGVSEYAGVVNELNQIKKTSIDYYAAIRSLYRQKRKS
jgi:phospholipid-binding lipoprotein MlaA